MILFKKKEFIFHLFVLITERNLITFKIMLYIIFIIINVNNSLPTNVNYKY